MRAAFRLWRWLALLLLLLAGLSAPAAARDRLVVALQLEPPTLDPTAGAAAAIKEVTYRTIFEGLTTLDATGAAVPLLATGWTMAPDAKSYLFHLRPGVRFHDGTPFDADVVRFSLLRAIRPGSTNAEAAQLGEIAGVDAIDPLTVRIRLSTADAALPVLLAWGDCVMVAARSAAGNATDPIGTGPFRYGDWRRGDRLTLVRNDHYWGAAPALASVEFRFIADPAAAYAAVKTHAVDLFTDYPAPENVAQLRADPTLRITTAPSQGEVILALNHRVAPLADLRVRRAISYALDRRAIIDGAMFGYGIPIGSHFPPQSPDHVDLTGRYPHDVARARALLAAAGYPRGFAITLKLPPPAYARRSGEIVAAELRAIGLSVTIVPVEWAQWLADVYGRHQFEATIVSHAEPDDYVIYGRPDYYFGYDGKAVRGLLARLKATADPRTRHDLLVAIQRRIAEDAVNGFLFQYPHIGVADAHLQNAWANTPLQEVDYGRARFDDAGGASPITAARGVGGMWLPLLLGAIALALVVRATGPGWVLRRLGVLALTLAGASLFIFALVQVAPGDPAQFMMGIEASPQAVASLRAELGLTGAPLHRYLGWIGGLLRGDLGTSYTYRVPVAALLGPRLALSLPLAGLAMLLAIPLGVGTALAGARRPGRMLDRATGGLTRLGLAVPGFWLAILLVLLFAVRLHWVAAGGFPGWGEGAWPAVRALLLPALALAVPQAAVIARVARGALAEELARDYVRTARAKGLAPRTILWRHALPNAAPAIVTIVGLQVPFLIAGSVIVEMVFALPGLGQLVLQAIAGRDLVTVQAVALLMVAATVLASFLADVGQRLADPRLRGRA
ncbi:ABC transporter substrate-binding protein [Sphingomonas nostoxanthinifaciens]|uniref:ABC transporter substrate-binding protein n=1 Tax=Sphingomonas nostoxanthinifaciens TaxID=2872652 RepID=UPI001CC1D62C|nr:ABC transporter substrate-binding protein [Sphingomonas nostoxanthinifaciens]UAK25184.1 ABC transporter permease subunit [Sphingomonas nostoxanthinifaciens]